MTVAHPPFALSLSKGVYGTACFDKLSTNGGRCAR